MKWPLSRDRLRFLMRRIRERLWIKPLLICVVSILAVFGAKVSDNLPLARLAPDVSSGSVESLLSIMVGPFLYSLNRCAGAASEAMAHCRSPSPGFSGAKDGLQRGGQRPGHGHGVARVRDAVRAPHLPHPGFM